MTRKQRDTHLVAVRSVVEKARAGKPAPVYGIVRRSEDLVQLLSAAPGAGLRRVGITNADDDSDRSIVDLPLGEQRVRLVLTRSCPVPDTIDVVDIDAELASRRRGLVPEAGLGTKHVVIAGAGSLGSPVAVLLAQAGVGRFTVIDNDVLDAANVSRHVCDLYDLGRRKAPAVADALVRRGVQAVPVDRSILDLTADALANLVAGADLVVATTDSVAAQLVMNEACVRAGLPGVFAGATALARVGEVVVVRPGTTACLYCFTGFRATLPDVYAPKERRLPYQDTDTEALTAEPGLAVDIGHIASVAAAHSLAVLDPNGSRTALLDPERNFVLVQSGSAPSEPFAELFRGPFEVVRSRMTRSEACPVCGYVSVEG